MSKTKKTFAAAIEQMSDKITIKDAWFNCNIGTTAEERSEKQPIIVTIELKTDIQKAADSNSIEDTIDYSAVHANIKPIIENNEHILIETLIETLAKEILNNFNTEEVKITIKKPHAMANRNVEYPAITIKRKK